MARIKYITAMTLLELLIVMSLSSLIILAALQVYFAEQQNSNFSRGLFTLQQHGTMAMGILADAIHHAGYIGCTTLNSDFTITQHIQMDTAITAKTILHDTYPKMPKNHVPGSSLLSLAHMVLNHDTLVETMHGSNKVIVNANSKLKSNDVVIIADCERADIVMIKAVKKIRTDKLLLILNNPIKPYKNAAQIGVWHQQLYYLGYTKRLDHNSKPIKALYVFDHHRRAMELVSGIDKLVFDLIKDDKGHTLAVDIHLLLNSIETILTKPQQIIFMGKQYQATDTMMYQYWHSSAVPMGRV